MREIWILNLLFLPNVLSWGSTHLTCRKSEGFESNTLTVSGNYIKFSEFLKTSDFASHSAPFWPYPCNGNNVKELIVVASKKLFFTLDINATGLQINISLISPLWVIDGERIIILDGLQGRDHISAVSGRRFGENGADGIDGLPGQNGGNFLGKFENIIYPENLQITSIGGCGGNGQDGGDGADGAPGESITKLDSCDSLLECYSVEDSNTLLNPGTVYCGKYTSPSLNQNDNYRFIPGWPGGPAGAGGIGGKPGKAGKGGKISLKSTNANLASKVNIIPVEGFEGRSGKNGKHGQVGERGNYAQCKLAIAVGTCSCNFYPDNMPEQLKSRKVEYFNGINGRSTSNSGTPNYICENSNLQSGKKRLSISGHSIKFSTIYNNIVANKYAPCSIQQLTELIVLCGDSFTMDVNFATKSKVFSIFLITPKLVKINGNVLLDGSFESSMYYKRGRAATGQWYKQYQYYYHYHDDDYGNWHTHCGDPGKHGLNGTDGKDGGSFFALIGEVTGTNPFIVRSIGGAGTSGQDGGHGGTFGGGGGNGGNGGNSGYYGYIQITMLGNSAHTLNTANLPQLWYTLTSSESTQSILYSFETSPGGRSGVRGEAAKAGWVYRCHNEDYEIINDCESYAFQDVYCPKQKNGKDGKDGTQRKQNILSNSALTKLFQGAIEKYQELFPEETFSEDYFLNRMFLNTEDKYPLLSYFKTSMLVNEMIILENKYISDSKLENRDEVYYKLYNLQLQKIKDFTTYNKKMNKKFSKSDSYALKCLFSLIISKLVAIKEQNDLVMIVDPAGYFDHLLTELETIKEAGENVKKQELSIAISQKLEESHEKILSLVEETEKYIEGPVADALTSIQAMFKDHVKAMSNEIQDIIEQAKQNVLDFKEKQKKLQKMRKKYEASVAGRVTCKALKFVGSIIGLMGPIGAAVNVGLQAAVGVGEAQLGEVKAPAIDLGSNFENPLKLADASHIEEHLKTWSWAKNFSYLKANGKKFPREWKPEFDNLKMHLDKMEKSLTTNIPEALVAEVEFFQSLNQVQQKIKKTRTTGRAHNSFSLSLLRNTTRLRYMSPSLINNYDQLVGRNDDDEGFTKDDVEKVTAGIDVMKNGADLTMFHFENQDQLDEFNYLEGQIYSKIKEAEDTVREVQKKQDQIFEQFLPMLQNIISNSTIDSGQQSISSLDVISYEVTSILTQLQDSINTNLEGLESKTAFVQSINKLIKALHLRIKLYNNIAHYGEQWELMNFIGGMSPHASNKSITEQQFRLKIDNLMLGVKNNLFMEKYKVAVDAFSKWAFPLGKSYFGNQGDLSELINYSESTLQELCENYKAKVKKMKGDMDKYRATVTKIDTYIFRRFFTKVGEHDNAFFVWKASEHQEAINNLLDFQAVDFLATVENRQKNVKRYAIKFSEVKIMFRAINPSEQEEIDTILGDFSIWLKHNGDSHYFVHDHEYVFYDNPITFSHSLKKKKDGNYTYTNLAMDKVSQSGSFLLSPYTLWSLEMDCESEDEELETKKTQLRKLVNRVDISLEGYGVYIYYKKQGMPAQIKALEIDKFYKFNLVK